MSEGQLDAEIEQLALKFSTEFSSAVRTLVDAYLARVRAQVAVASAALSSLPDSNKGPVLVGPAPQVAPRIEAKKRIRRSTDTLAAECKKIVDHVRKHPEGQSSEQIKAALKMPKKDFGRPLKLALASKELRKLGKRRSTTYYAKPEKKA